MDKKYFTVEEANALLPLVRDQLETLRQLKKQFEEKYVDLRGMKLLHRYHEQPKEPDPYFMLECELEFIQLQFQSGVSNLELKGIELKDVEHGLVDFPAVIDGEEVLLCWKWGEPRITHYHGLYDGYAGRKPLERDET